MKRVAWLLLLLLCAFGVDGSGVNVRMADLVELSNGTVARVWSNRNITGSGKSTGSDLMVFVEDQDWRRVGMKSSSDAEGTVTAVFWSPSGKDRVEVVAQLGFVEDNLAVPHVVKINGKRFRALIPAADAIAYEAFADRMRAESEKQLSPTFRAALRQLWALGEAGYTGMGTGWIAAEFVCPSLPKGLSIVNKVAMSPAEEEGFQALFAK